MYQCERYLNQTNGRLGEQSDQVRVFLPFNTLRYVTGIVAAYMCIKYLVFYRCMLPLYQRLLEYVRNRKKLLKMGVRAMISLMINKRKYSENLQTDLGESFILHLNFFSEPCDHPFSKVKKCEKINKFICQQKPLLEQETNIFYATYKLLPVEISVRKIC